MKRLFIPLLLCCLLLTGCARRGDEKRFAAFSDALAAKEALSFTAEVRAEYADRTLDFTLRYEKDAAGETVTLLRPERIAGIKAHLAPGETALEYEGLILETGPLDPYGLTPMNALPKLVQALAGGHLDSHWTEDGAPVYKLILDDALSVTARFDPEGMIPRACELQSGEKVCISCEISDWR